MALRGAKAVKEEKRLKLFVYGAAGRGKTTAAIQFPKAYIIDTEHGTDQYADMINKNESVVFRTTDIDEAKTEIRALTTEKHDFRTLVIDPITILYESCQFKWEKKFNNPNDMRRWTRIKSDMKSLQHMLLDLDMNVIVTAHQKILYGDGMTKIGDTFDSMKGDDYLFDYVFQLTQQKASKVPLAVTEKQRAEIGTPKFPDTFEWSYQNFLKFYGEAMINKESKPKKLADEALVSDFVLLLSIVKIGSDILDKWGISEPLTIEEKNELMEMPYDELKKRADYLRAKLPKLETNSQEQSPKESKKQPIAEEPEEPIQEQPQEQSENSISQEQVDNLKAIMTAKGYTFNKIVMAVKRNIGQLSELTKDEYEKIVTAWQ